MMNSVRTFRSRHTLFSPLAMVQRRVNHKNQPDQSSSSKAVSIDSINSKKGKYAIDVSSSNTSKRPISSNAALPNQQQQQPFTRQNTLSNKSLSQSSSQSSSQSFYTYIDSGDYLRLEKFGPLIVTRSCPSASWPRNRNILEWNLQQSALRYEGTSGKLGIWNGQALDENQNGFLSKSDSVNWTVTMDGNITFVLNPSEYGQVGVFPEQLSNWQWITKQCIKHVDAIQLKYPHIISDKSMATCNDDKDILNDDNDDDDDDLDEEYTQSNTSLRKDTSNSNQITSIQMEKHLNSLKNNPKYNHTLLSNTTLAAPPCMRVLNGFAYTGGSTLAAARVDQVEVIHLDAAKSVVVTAFKNACMSGLEHRPVRYIVDDCQQFVDREIRRQNKYDGLIFDPPAFGRSSRSKHGAKSAIWKLDYDLPLLVSKFRKLLSSEAKFVLLTCHDVEWPAERLAELLSEFLPEDGLIEYGELILSPDLITAVQTDINHNDDDDDEIERGNVIGRNPGIKKNGESKINFRSSSGKERVIESVASVFLGNDLPLGQYARWYRE